MTKEIKDSRSYNGSAMAHSAREWQEEFLSYAGISIDDPDIVCECEGNCYVAYYDLGNGEMSSIVIDIQETDSLNGRTVIREGTLHKMRRFLRENESEYARISFEKDYIAPNGKTQSYSVYLKKKKIADGSIVLKAKIGGDGEDESIRYRKGTIIPVCRTDPKRVERTARAEERIKKLHYDGNRKASWYSIESDLGLVKEGYPEMIGFVICDGKAMYENNGSDDLLEKLRAAISEANPEAADTLIDGLVVDSLI